MQKFKLLTTAELKEIDQRQIEQHKLWKAVPQSGMKLPFADFELLLMPGVYPPKTETQLMIEYLPLKQTHEVLDLGTGSGALAIWAAQQGAARIVATDIAGAATYNARQNVGRMGFNQNIEVRSGNMFACVSRLETFDLILANLPGRNKFAADDTDAAHWDTEFQAHKALFEGGARHLKENGGIYMVKANYPDLPVAIELADQNGFNSQVIAECEAADDDPRTYYVLKFSQ